MYFRINARFRFFEVTINIPSVVIPTFPAKHPISLVVRLTPSMHLSGIWNDPSSTRRDQHFLERMMVNLRKAPKIIQDLVIRRLMLLVEAHPRLLKDDHDVQRSGDTHPTIFSLKPDCGTIADAPSFTRRVVRSEVPFVSDR